MDLRRMLPLPTLADDRERVRLEALRSYRLDSPSPEAAFNHVAHLAADLFEAPIALVSFVGEHEQTFKGRVGLDTYRTARDTSFCAHAIVQDDVLVVEDARADPRFQDNPHVTGEPFIRFYAGAPIINPEGHRLGSVCVIDAVPRPSLTERQRGLLRSLARIVMDSLEQRRLDTVRRAALRMAAAIPDAIVCVDEAGRVTFWNTAAERIFGFERSEMLGQPLARIVPAEFLPHHRTLMKRRFARRGNAVEQAREVICLRRDGSRIAVEVTPTTWCDGSHANVGLIFRDLSERDRARERVRHLTHFDPLTNLPNRAHFLEWIDQTLSSVGNLAVLKVGLDRFKAVNGTVGMAAGDRVLVAAAERVRAEAGPSAFVARLGADEFGVLLADADAAARAGALAQRLVDRLGEPFHVGTSVCHLGASVGVARHPDASDVSMDANCVLRRALLALQQAKMAGGRRVEVFQQQLGQQAEERRRIEDDLRGALNCGEFELHFQPQVNLPGGDVVGAEALLRWRHPERGLLSPAAFLPVLETSEMAVPVGRWIIREACAFASLMASRGLPLRMGVNLFAAQMRSSDLFADVTEALATARLPARSLEVEITETTVLGLDELTIEPLRRLRDLGVGIAFDDYGTGYASLSLLKRYPLTRLKIDREFVRDLRSDPDDAAIVKAVIALGGSLGLEVIAEGIEAPEQALALASFGCREAQGYLFGKPMPAPEFTARFASAFVREVA